MPTRRRRTFDRARKLPASHVEEHARTAVLAVASPVLVYTLDGMPPGYVVEAFIDAPGPRTGVASLLNGEPISDDILRAVPETT